MNEDQPVQPSGQLELLAVLQAADGPDVQLMSLLLAPGVTNEGLLVTLMNDVRDGNP